MSFIFSTKTVYASGESSLLDSPDALFATPDYVLNLTKQKRGVNKMIVSQMKK